ncbi:MAG TPA: hypothetical protein VFE15_14850 [Marmoricola sp.]|jgi:nitrite reductase (NO-forming)|nr:hypothetical protein [Marmoricola sp.]
MTTTATSPATPSTTPGAVGPDGEVVVAFAPTRSRLRGAAIARIAFGVVWAIDATFKFLPGFVHGQTLHDELGKGSEVSTPVIHQWIEMWNTIALSHPQTFAVGTGIVETAIALGLIFGAFSNLVFLGSAVFSFGIWSAAEGFHLPWSKPGMTDLGPSVGYIFASLALFFACAAATWSLDKVIRPRLGRFAGLASRTA